MRPLWRKIWPPRTTKSPMQQERRANATTFWQTTRELRINTPQFNTPWNGFTANKDILVVSIWLNEIVPLKDPLSGSVRRFVRLGDVPHATGLDETR